MAFVANRAMTINGQAHRPGEAVDANGLETEKARQLVAQRILTDTTVMAPARCVAMRRMRVGDREYRRGELVDVSRLRPEKISQMLDHRMLDLARSDAVEGAKPSVRRAARA